MCQALFSVLSYTISFNFDSFSMRYNYHYFFFLNNYHYYPHFIARKTKALSPQIIGPRKVTQLTHMWWRQISKHDISITALRLRQWQSNYWQYLTHQKRSVPVQSRHCWQRCTHRHLRQTRWPFQYPSSQWQILWVRKQEDF